MKNADVSRNILYNFTCLKISLPSLFRMDGLDFEI